MTQRRKLLGAVAFVALAASLQQAALAQTANAPIGARADVRVKPAEPDGDIIVTATRRANTLQQVPLSITALNEAALQARTATSFLDYAGAAPNLSFGTTGEGVSGSRTIAIRGVADAKTTGFYIDDTPLPESLDPRVVGIDRIEVLRGPQGTLYGARSMGGTVRLITTQPDPTRLSGEVHGLASGTRLGGFNYQVDGAVNLPIATDVAALRLGGFSSQDSGYFSRVFNTPGGTPGQTTEKQNIGRVRSYGAQAALQLRPASGLTITPRIIYQHTASNGFPFADVAVPAGLVSTVLQPGSLVQRRAFDIAEGGRDRWALGSVDIQYKTGIGQIISSTSFFDRKIRDQEDYSSYIPSLVGGLVPPVPGLAQLYRRTRQFTQEVRFSSDFSGPFQLIVGGYFSKARELRQIAPTYQSTLLLLGFPTDLVLDSSLRSRTREIAAFGEASYSLTSHLKATVGLRAFDTRLSADQTAVGVAVGGVASFPNTVNSEHGVTPKLNLQYSFDKNNQIYANVAKGFRPGGVNGLVPTAFGCAANLAALGLTQDSTKFYRSDSLWSYELGAKTSLFSRALTLNGAIFQIDWDNIQQRISLACGFAFRSNNGKARSRGFEAEATLRPMPGLTLTAGAGYTNAKFTESPAAAQYKAGDRVPQVPRWTATTAVDYNRDIGDRKRLFAHLDYRYVGSSVSDTNSVSDPSTGRLVPRIRPSYSLVDGRIGIGFGRYEVALFGKNLTDERASLSDSQSIAAETAGVARVVVNPPRTLGAELRARF